MIANTKTNKNKNIKIFNLVNNIYLSFKLNSKRYALLFAALLPVYAQADVSVSDDPKPQESTELPIITVTADRTASSNDGYTVSGTHTPLGLPMTLREIP